MEWKEELMVEAKDKRMCLENFRALGECKDKGTAIKLYKKTIDWALEEDFPKLDTITKHFDDSEEQGVFVGKVFSGEEFSEQLVYVFHACTGTINVAMDIAGANIPMLYFANGCDITVECTQKNVIPICVPIYIFGDNNITAKDNDSAIYRIYREEVKS